MRAEEENAVNGEGSRSVRIPQPSAFPFAATGGEKRETDGTGPTFF